MFSLDQQQDSKQIVDNAWGQVAPAAPLSVSTVDNSSTESVDQRMQTVGSKRLRSDGSTDGSTDEESAPLASRVKRVRHDGDRGAARASLGQAIDSVDERLRQEFQKINDRHEEVSKLHGLVEMLNNATKDGGNVEFSAEELAEFQKRAAELGVVLPKLDAKISKEQKTSIVQNINMRVDDLSTLSQKDFFKLQTLNQRKQQLWELLAGMEKLIHDIIMSIARKLGG